MVFHIVYVLESLGEIYIYIYTYIYIYMYIYIHGCPGPSSGYLDSVDLIIGYAFLRSPTSDPFSSRG